MGEIRDAITAGKLEPTERFVFSTGNCIYCHGYGWIEDVDPNGYIFAEECICTEQRREWRKQRLRAEKEATKG